MTANADQIAYWNAAAGDTWAGLQARLDRQIGPLGEAALMALAPAPGARLLDIGCGCGDTTLALSQAAAPGGRVLGVDVSLPMLEVARARAGAREGISFLQADAQTHAFEQGGWDGIYSRFGVMFFDDPSAAFSNLRAALRPDGRLAFVCWRALRENPWMAAPLAGALDALGQAPTPSEPFAPGPFAFADPNRVRDILHAAGFGAIDIAAHDAKIPGGSLNEALATALKVGPLGALLREHPDKVEPAVAAVRQALCAFDTPHGVMMPAAVWIVTARG